MDDNEEEQQYDPKYNYPRFQVERELRDFNERLHKTAWTDTNEANYETWTEMDWRGWLSDDPQDLPAYDPDVRFGQRPEKVQHVQDSSPDFWGNWTHNDRESERSKKRWL